MESYRTSRKRIVHQGIGVVFLLSAAFIIMSCKKAEDAPPDLVIDRTACARCKMLISDSRFAAALKIGEYLIFDDIGCMLAYAKSLSNINSSDIWVRDYKEEKWMKAQSATFYFDAQKRTPMGYGYVAIKTGSESPQGFAFIGSVSDLRNKFASQ